MRHVSNSCTTANMQAATPKPLSDMPTRPTHITAVPAGRVGLSTDCRGAPAAGIVAVLIVADISYTE